MAEKINISSLPPIGFINQQNPTKLPEENNNTSKRSSSTSNQQLQQSQAQSQNNQQKQQNQQSQTKNQNSNVKDDNTKNSEPKKPDNIKKSDIVSDEEFDNIMFLLEEIEFDTDEQKEAASNLYKRIWENQKKFSNTQKKQITSHKNFQKLRNLYTNREDEHTPKYLTDIKDLFNFTKQKHIQLAESSFITASGSLYESLTDFLPTVTDKKDLESKNKNLLNQIILKHSGQNVQNNTIEMPYIFLMPDDIINKIEDTQKNFDYYSCIVKIDYNLGNKNQNPIAELSYIIFKNAKEDIDKLKTDDLRKIKIEFESIKDLYDIIKPSISNIKEIINLIIQYSAKKYNIEIEDKDDIKMQEETESLESEVESEIADYNNEKINVEEVMENISSTIEDSLNIDNFIKLVKFPASINEDDPYYNITLDTSENNIKIIVNKHLTTTNPISEKNINDVLNVKEENIIVNDYDIDKYIKSNVSDNEKDTSGNKNRKLEIKNNKKELKKVRKWKKENLINDYVFNKLAGDSEKFDEFFLPHIDGDKLILPVNLFSLKEIISDLINNFQKYKKVINDFYDNEIHSKSKGLEEINKEFNSQNINIDINELNTNFDNLIKYKNIIFGEFVYKEKHNFIYLILNDIIENINQNSNFSNDYFNFNTQNFPIPKILSDTLGEKYNSVKYNEIFSFINTSDINIIKRVKEISKKFDEKIKKENLDVSTLFSKKQNMVTSIINKQNNIQHNKNAITNKKSEKVKQKEKIKKYNIGKNPYKNINIKIDSQTINLANEFEKYIHSPAFDKGNTEIYFNEIESLKRYLQEYFINKKTDANLTIKFISLCRFLKIKTNEKDFNKVDFFIKDFNSSNSNDYKKITITIQQLTTYLSRITNYDFSIEVDRNSFKFKNESINESFVLRLKNKKLLLEELIQRNNESNQEKISKEEIKNKVKKIEKLEKEIEKVEDHSEKKKRIEDLKKFKESVRNEIDYKIILNISHMINSLKDAENPESQKVISTFKKSLGFEPSVLNFALNSLSKFKSMCEINRIISNVVLSNVINILMELNIVYYISTNEDVDSQMLKDMYVKYESNFNSLYQSFKSEEVIDNFEKLVEKVKEDFGASSEITDLCTKMYNDIIKTMEEMNNRLKKFKMLLSKYWEEYSSLEEEKKKIEYVLHLIDVFENLKESKEMKNLYVIYTKNKNYFLEDLKMTMLKNVKLNFDKILENENKETFVNIYSEEKLKFDKVNNTCVELLGKNIGEGKLGKVFSEISVKKKELIEKLNNAGKEKEEPKNKEQKKVKSEENPENKKQDNINTKPEQENKPEDKRDKNESKLIKQDLKILNNKNSKLKLIVKG